MTALRLVVVQGRCHRVRFPRRRAVPGVVASAVVPVFLGRLEHFTETAAKLLGMVNAEQSPRPPQAGARRPNRRSGAGRRRSGARPAPPLQWSAA